MIEQLLSVLARYTELHADLDALDLPPADHAEYRGVLDWIVSEALRDLCILLGLAPPERPEDVLSDLWWRCHA